MEPLTFTEISALGQTAFNRWFYIQVITTSSSFSVELFEADGTQVPVTIPAYPRTLRISSRDVIIGKNYNGIIHGVKYYKTNNPPTKGIYAMKVGYDQSTECLLYFMFKQ